MLLLKILKSTVDLQLKCSCLNDHMQYKEYLASVHFSAPDEVFHGKVLGTSDLIIFEGTSVRDLKKAFREAVDDYIESCSLTGKEPNKSYKGTFNVRIPTDMHKDAAVFAAIHNVSLNDFVKSAIHYALLHKRDMANQIKR